MGRGSKGDDGARANEGAAPNTVSDSVNDGLIRGVHAMSDAERARLQDVNAKTYQAFLANGGSD